MVLFAAFWSLKLDLLKTFFFWKISRVSKLSLYMYIMRICSPLQFLMMVKVIAFLVKAHALLMMVRVIVHVLLVKAQPLLPRLMLFGPVAAAVCIPVIAAVAVVVDTAVAAVGELDFAAAGSFPEAIKKIMIISNAKIEKLKINPPKKV